MKPHFSFFLVFAFFFASAQKKDTVFRQPDCTKFHQAEKEKFDVLEKDFKKVNFSKLNKLIINHIDESRLKKQNLKISLIKRKMTICGWDIFRDCISKYNLTNNFYNEPQFARQVQRLVGKQKVPPQLDQDYVISIVDVFLSNGYGVCWAANDIYKELIVRFSEKHAFIAVTSFNIERISNKLNQSICSNKFKELLDLLKLNASNPALLEFIDFILQNKGPYSSLASETKVKQRVASLRVQYKI